MPYASHEEQLEYWRRYYQLNKEHICDRISKYRQDNLKKVRGQQRSNYWKRISFKRKEARDFWNKNKEPTNC